jgi:lysine 6-dehydrogenase
MKVVVLGGVGEVGTVVTTELASCHEVDEVVIADKQHERAEELALRFSQNRVKAIKVDLRDRDAALSILADTNIVVNCTPFSWFDQVIQLAVEARVDYADLISQPSEEQRRAVADAGITAISGLGQSPGLTNVLVRHASEELDELEEVHISWASTRTIAPSLGLLDTVLWETSEDSPTRQYFQNGRFHRAGYMEGSRTVDFPSPLGSRRVYFVPHTETTTLPRNFPRLQFCAVRGTWRTEDMEDMRVLNKYGLLDHSPVSVDGHDVCMFDVTRQRIWERIGGHRDVCPWMSFLNVDVVGAREGASVRWVYNVTHPLDWGDQATARMTGIPAAVGIQLLARHGRTQIGLLDPEVYYDPYEFLATLKERGNVSVIREELPVTG